MTLLTQILYGSDEVPEGKFGTASGFLYGKDSVLSTTTIDAIVAKYLADHPNAGGLTSGQVNALIKTYAEDNNILVDIDTLNSLTHELSVEYEYQWENDNDVQFAFTGTEPTPNNIAGLDYRSVRKLSQSAGNQYIVVRIPRSDDPGNVHNYRLRATESGSEDRIIPSNQLSQLHLDSNYRYYGFTQIPGSGTLSQTLISSSRTWHGQHDVQVQRNTIFHGDLALDNREPSEQHFAIDFATPVTAANSVGNGWYGRRIIFTGALQKIVESKQGDIDFLAFEDNYQVNDITDPDRLWANETATYSKHLFNFRVAGRYKLRLLLNHLSSDSRGVVVRFMRINPLLQPDTKVSEVAFTSVSTQNLPNNVVGGAQTAAAYPNVLESDVFTISSDDISTLRPRHFNIVMFEKLNNVNNADTFSGRMEIIRVGD